MGSYHVVTKNTMLDLEIAVSKKMTDGWECTGGLTVHTSRSEWRNYSQPMVKYEQPKFKDLKDHVHTGGVNFSNELTRGTLTRGPHSSILESLK